MPAHALDRDAFERRPVKPIQSTFFNSILVNLEYRHAEDPAGTLAALPWAVMEATGAQSAGVSLREDGRLRWPAVAGRWSAQQGRAVPLAELPCGLALQAGRWEAFALPQDHFAGLQGLAPVAIESLHAPIAQHGQGAAPGTLWAVLHNGAGQFDSQDAFMLAALAQLAGRLLRLP